MVLLVLFSADPKLFTSSHMQANHKPWRLYRWGMVLGVVIFLVLFLVVVQRYLRGGYRLLPASAACHSCSCSSRVKHHRQSFYKATVCTNQESWTTIDS
jgi:hypothetical protein